MIIGSTGVQHLRGLQQSATCPMGCVDSTGCVQDATSGGLRCIACHGSLRVRNDGLCGCSPGSFYSGPNTCFSCVKGSYCPGGPLTADSQPQQLDCPEGTTTLGARSSTNLQCGELNKASERLTRISLQKLAIKDGVWLDFVSQMLRAYCTRTHFVCHNHRQVLPGAALVSCSRHVML